MAVSSSSFKATPGAPIGMRTLVLVILVVIGSPQLSECRGRRRGGGSLDVLAGTISYFETINSQALNEVILLTSGFCQISLAELFASGTNEQHDPYAIENIIPLDLIERTRHNSASASNTIKTC